jgi:regulatory protein
MARTGEQWVQMTMPVVTAIETQKNNPERVNVYLDGRFAFGASALVIVARHVTLGRELSIEEIESLEGEDSAERAYNAALNFLSYRPRSAREIQDYFRRKAVDPDIVDAVIDRLKRINLVNDDEFARFWVENRQNFRPRGARALRVELRQKGLASETIEDALGSIGDEGDIALGAGRKKMGSYRGLDDRAFLTRMIGFLQRRGFDYGVASRSARSLLEERGGSLTDEELDLGPEEIASD